MQVLIDDEWHRPMLDPNGLRNSYGIPHETACEVATAGKYARTRTASYEGKLCTRGCFTPAELARAAAQTEARERRTTEETNRLEREREEWFATGIRRKDKP